MAMSIRSSSSVQADRSDTCRRGETDRDEPHVLVTDDDLLSRMLMEDLLSEWGARVSFAENGMEALKHVAQRRFDLVLMDIRLPDLDGYDVTRAIRQRPEGRKLPIVALTAGAMRGEREKCLSAGMDDYIDKPVQLDRLRAVLGRWIRLRAPVADVYPAAMEGDDGSGLPQRLPGIDIETGLLFADRNSRHFGKQLRQFRDQYARVPAQLLDWLQVGDMQTLGRVAHSLTGSAAGLGAMALAEAARELDRAVNEEQTGIVRALIEGPLRANLAEVLNGLADLPEQKSGAEPGRQISLESAIAELRHLLEQGDFRAGEYFAGTKQQLEARFPVQLVQDLERQIDTFQYASALDICSALKPDGKA